MFTMDKARFEIEFQTVLDKIKDEDEKERFINFVKKQMNIALLFSVGDTEMLEIYSEM